MLLLCALLGLLFAPNLALLWRHPELIPFVRGILVCGVLCAAVFALCGRRLWIACALFLPFVVLAPAEMFYILRYDRPSDANIMATVFESNLREASEFLGDARYYLIAAVCLAALVGIAAVVQVRRSRLAWTHRSAKWVVAVVLGVPLLSVALAVLSPTRRANGIGAAVDDTLQRLAVEVYMTYPFGLADRYLEYRREWAAMRDASAALAGFRFGAHPRVPVGERQVYVLVIGEASRRDHWSLFGYARATNPQLAATTNLVTLPDMISPWAASRWAVPMIVTRKPDTDWNAYFTEPSVTRVFQEAGFHTYWYSTQSAVGMYDSPISVNAFDAMQVRFFNPSGSEGERSYDDQLLPPLRAALAASDRNLFIVLHTLGSHQEYRARFPREFDRFTPSLPGDADFTRSAAIERETNAYDNSVLFTDHVLKAVIDELAQSRAITAMLYVADHGEMLPDGNCSVIGHGFSGLPVYPVPALFWYSDRYAKAFPEKLAALQANAKQPLSTTHVFESLVDMADLDFPGRAAQASLFDARFTPTRRFVHADTLVDFDHKRVLPGCQVVVPDQAGAP